MFQSSDVVLSLPPAGLILSSSGSVILFSLTLSVRFLLLVLILELNISLQFELFVFLS